MNPDADLLPILIERWHDRIGAFSVYLKSQFNFGLEASPHGVLPSLIPTQLLIVQMADGDSNSDNIGRDALAKWLYAQGTLRQVPLEYAWDTMYKCDPSGLSYCTTSFLFYIDHNVLLSERYGPNFIQRSLGNIIDDKREILWSTLWSDKLN